MAGGGNKGEERMAAGEERIKEKSGWLEERNEEKGRENS